MTEKKCTTCRHENKTLVEKPCAICFEIMQTTGVYNYPEWKPVEVVNMYFPKKEG
jgi:hypothetical protein